MTSASPCAILRPASPMQCVDVAQAVTTEIFGPVRCCMMLTCPDVILMMLPGIKNGDTLRGTAGQQLVVVVLDVLDAADTGAHRNADTVTVFFGDLETGILDRINAGSDPVVYERVVLALVFFSR